MRSWTKQIMNDNQAYNQAYQSSNWMPSRGQFISRTYIICSSAIAAFTLLEIFLYQGRVGGAVAKGHAGHLVVAGARWVRGVSGWPGVWSIAPERSPPSTCASRLCRGRRSFSCRCLDGDRFAPGAITSARRLRFLAFTALTLWCFSPARISPSLRGILMWRHHCAGVDRGGRDFWISTRHYFSVGDGGAGGRGDSV